MGNELGKLADHREEHFADGGCEFFSFGIDLDITKPFRKFQLSADLVKRTSRNREEMRVILLRKSTVPLCNV